MFAMSVRAADARGIFHAQPADETTRGNVVQPGLQ
jgi:hypothetical protein